MAVRSVVAPAPQTEPASRLKNATRDVSFLRSDSRCRQNVNDLSNVTPRYLGSEQKGKGFVVAFDFKLTFSFLVRWKAANTVFVMLSFSFQVWRYSSALAMSLTAPLPLHASLHQHA